MENIVFENPDQFNELISKVDDKLANDGLSIPQRPLTALSEISKEFGITLPMSHPLPGMPDELLQNWPISEHIRDWYTNKYGSRLNVDFRIGRMAVLIKKDLWIFSFPKIYGSVEFVSSKTHKSERIGSKGKPLVYNILDCIQDMPQDFRMSLTEAQLLKLLNDFILGFNAMTSRQMARGNNLVGLAWSDISASIDHMVAQSPQYGLSKWSSLQAAEKIIKACIELEGGKYKFTHDLNDLIAKLPRSVLSSEVRSIVNRIQCTPAIRYGKEPCDKIAAAKAHYSVFQLIEAIFSKVM